MAKKKKHQPLYLLGLDPSLNSHGYAVLDVGGDFPQLVEKGVFTGASKSNWDKRETVDKLRFIQGGLISLLAKYRPLHENVFIERGYSKFATATQQLYRVRGIIEAELHYKQIVELPPTSVKLIITGNGSASKEEVAIKVANKLGLEVDVFANDDESDATAVALAGWLSLKKKEM